MNGESVVPPVIRTSRLVLSPLSSAHADGMFELWSAAEVCEFAGRVTDLDGRELELPARDRRASDAIIAFFEALAAEGRALRWAVEDHSGAFVGAIGFNRVGPCVELAYHQVPRHWGRGLMSEACTAALDRAASWGASESEAFVEPANRRSVRLLERLGFATDGSSRDGAARHVLGLRDRSASSLD